MTDKFCKFCGTVPSQGDRACSTLSQALRQTPEWPLGCPWFSQEDRKDRIMKWEQDTGDYSWFAVDAYGCSYRVQKVLDAQMNWIWVCAWTEDKGPRIGSHAYATAEEAKAGIENIATIEA